MCNPSEQSTKIVEFFICAEVIHWMGSSPVSVKFAEVHAPSNDNLRFL